MHPPPNCAILTQTWDSELLQRVGLPTRLFTTPVTPGTFAGSLLVSMSEEIGIPSLPMIAIAEHDTASAVAAIPTEEELFAYLSCGTWSLIGTEVAQPILTEQALAWSVTNEGGVNGTFRLLKNVTGLWLLQECQRAWRNEGKLFSRYQEGHWSNRHVPFKHSSIPMPLRLCIHSICLARFNSIGARKERISVQPLVLPNSPFTTC